MAIANATLAGFLNASLLVPGTIIAALLVSSIIENENIHKPAWDLEAWRVVAYGIYYSLGTAIVAVVAAVVLGHVVKWIFG